MKMLRLCAAFVCVACMVGCSRSGDYDQIVVLRDTLKADPYDVEALAELIGYLDDDHWLDPGNAAGCFRQLAESERSKREIVPVIGPIVVHALVENADNIGREATNTLREYSPYTLPYLTELIRIVQEHPSDDMGLFAVEAIGNLGTSAAEAIPVIESLQYQEHWKEYQGDALDKLRGEQTPEAKGQVK